MVRVPVSNDRLHSTPTQNNWKKTFFRIYGDIWSLYLCNYTSLYMLSRTESMGLAKSVRTELSQVQAGWFYYAIHVFFYIHMQIRSNYLLPTLAPRSQSQPPPPHATLNAVKYFNWTTCSCHKAIVLICQVINTADRIKSERKQTSRH